ncbi:MAG: cob(I)yrinic acid a,c-diamide adenosyltransferase [Candidatus Thalassarchaeaceae archaeon]|jgi:cob(I)alamin adenosyltransferase|nr:cob(I)yrinic acid a,c-diamide adenosyltransferase [Candidatus Thalassarchaeaceae archaeon]
MVRITKVHTGNGDRGETSLASGERVSKCDPRVDFYGTIDELNSIIGMVRAELDRMDTHHDDGGARATVRTVKIQGESKLALLQQELFDIGGEAAFLPDHVPAAMTVIEQSQADRLCAEMDAWTEDLTPLESFILPAGCPFIATMHLARTVTRRVERAALRLRETEGNESVRDVVIAYLNRLSDWFFVFIRWSTMTLGGDETLWVPLGKRNLS